MSPFIKRVSVVFPQPDSPQIKTTSPSWIVKFIFSIFPLSHTDAVWPGDADLIILDKSTSPVALIEYKKHTLDTPINNQKLLNYYPSRDKRKYDRLEILRSFLGSGTQFINLYYPTNPMHKVMKFEKIIGNIGSLQGGNVTECNIPKNKREYPNVVNSLLHFI